MIIRNYKKKCFKELPRIEPIRKCVEIPHVAVIKNSKISHQHIYLELSIRLSPKRTFYICKVPPVKE